MLNSEDPISARRYVPPSFNDIRRIMNLAQVLEISKDIKFVSFDGDMTLYADGKDFEKDNVLAELIIQLLKKNIFVAIITAAAYGEESEKYQNRISGLIHNFCQSRLDESQLKRFYVFGGECNYLFQMQKNSTLKFVPESTYTSVDIKYINCSQEDVESLLDCAQKNLKECMDSMKLDCKLIRKSRAVGVLPITKDKCRREQLDECVLSTQACLSEKTKMLQRNVPFCAFNGGSDVWVDIGNKSIGVDMLLKYLSINPSKSLHVGDQFLSTGNDFATRTSCCTVWIVNPEETRDILSRLVNLIK